MTYGPKYRLTGGDDMPENWTLRLGVDPLEGRIVEWINTKLPLIVPPQGYRIDWHCEAVESQTPDVVTITVRPELRRIARFTED